MRILVALDSFKDGCSSFEACKAVARGCQKANPSAEITICPLSDGGEGTVEILQYHLGGELVQADVSNPLFKTISASYLIMDSQVAFIEMAAASGLELLTEEERNPLNTSTFGTGQLILDAIDRGCSQIILSVGGSATNDLGIGMASTLGIQFLEENGSALAPIGHNLSKVSKMDLSNRDSRLSDISFNVITDVSNPLFGDNGAAYIYAGQKGANDKAIEHLDIGLRKMNELIKSALGNDISEIPGSGAAGGLSGGCMAFFDAEIDSGFEVISEHIELSKKIKAVDIIITGEGRIDEQTNQGKVIDGISRLAASLKVPVVGFCGSSTIDDAAELGLIDIIEISPKTSSLSENLTMTAQNLENQASKWMTAYLLS